MQLRRRRSILAALGTAILSAGLGTPVVVAVVAPAPEVFIEDAPFVRHQVVQLGLIQYDATGGAIVERRVSNDPATSGGILVNGVATPEIGPWTLAAGPPGTRTVYGQFHYASGAWSAVASSTVTLDTSVNSALYIDADPRAFYPATAVPVDYHEIIRAPADVFYGQAHVDDSAGNDSFNVNAGGWSVSFGLADGPITAGSYQALDPPSEDTVAPVFAAVLAPSSVGCDGHGPFTIHSIAFTDEGDLESVSADFSLTCLDAVVSGSLRYGTTGAFVALDQSLDYSQFGEHVVGGAPVEDSVTFTNIGTAPTTLGDAELSGPQAADFDIVADDCSGETLSVSEDCEIAYRFEPGARGLRQAFLTVPDETQSERRSLYLQGVGLQPTALTLATGSIPQFGPAEATIEVTVTPDTANGTTAAVPLVSFDGVQAFGPTDEGSTGSGGRTYAYTKVVTPGHHVVTSEFGATDFFLGSTATPIAFDVGTKTSLTLTTTTDDGVALGETATLIASLDTGAAIPGGTLEIRDGVTDALLASAVVSGNDPTLTKTLTPGLGTHGYTARFIPPNPTVQASSATYDLTVVAGTRPETIMASDPLYSPWTTVTSPFSSPDASATFQCRVDAANWYPCTSPATFSANPPDPHQISVRAVGTNGLADRSPATRTWIIDTVAPTVTTPKVALLPTSSFASGKVPVRVSWVGADAGGSGVAGYRVERQIDGGSWITVADDTQADSLDQSLSVGHYYRYRVRVLDEFAHESISANSTTLSLRRFAETSPVVKYTGTWATSRSSSYYGGVAKASSKAGSTASIKATMKTVEWVSRIGPTRGKAKVAVDGVTVATVNLYATTASGPRIVWSKTWSSAGSHRVTITVAGTVGHPSVIVDEFIVAS